MSSNPRYSAAATVDHPSDQAYVSALLKKYREHKDSNMLLWISLPTPIHAARVEARLRAKIAKAQSIGLSERPLLYVSICFLTNGSPELTPDEVLSVKRYAAPPLSDFAVDVFTADADSD